MTISKFDILQKLDPRDPASIQALIEFHRSAFGDATMTAGAPEGGDGGTGSAGGGTGGDAGDAGNDTQDGTNGPQKAAEGDQKVEDLPEWAQKLIRDTRADAAARRANAENAAKAERDQLVQTLGKALGFVKDEDAAKVNEQELTSKLTEAQQTARDNAANLVVWQNATALGVDPAALTDSRSFAAAIAKLDPTDPKFVDDVKAAAKASLQANPKLAAAPGAPRRAGVGLPGGAGDAGKGRASISLEDAVAAAYAK